MADNYIYNSNEGVVIADTSNIKATVQQEYKTALGDNINLDDSTPQGRLIDAETTARVNVINNNALMANLFNLKQSFGIYLDSLAGSFVKYRQGATQSQVPVVLGGASGTVIAQGSRASMSNGVIFYAPNDFTIGADGTVSGTFVSQEYGAIPCPANSLTKIIDGTFGWETINNPSSATVGQEKQSDASFKRDIMNSGLFKGRALLEDYKSAIYSVDGVSSCFVYDNYTNSSITYDSITINAHSIYCCVYGGSNQDVANAIFGVKSGGCGYTGNTSISVIDETFGSSYTVSFQRPTLITIYIEVNVKNINNSSTDLEEQMQNILVDYAGGNLEGFDNLGIGKDVNVFDLSSVIGANITGITIQSILIGTTAGTLSASTININVGQIASVVADNITVNIS